jgi:hypothetical protein
MGLLETEEIQYTKKGTLRKRKPKTSNQYFTQETEDAIIEYLNTTSPYLRNKIYNEKIKYAFHKLTENIIHTFKFYYTEVETIAELQHEVIAFLLEKLHLFNHSKSINDKLTKIITKEFKEKYTKDAFINYTNNSVTVTQSQIDNFINNLNLSSECLEAVKVITPPKAYSYFGTIVKRYLINYNNKIYDKIKSKTEVADIDEDKSITLDIINSSTDFEDELMGQNYFINKFIEYVDIHLFKIFPNKEDAKTVDAILALFKHRENIDIFNKKGIYIYIREQTEQDTPQITKIMKNLKKVYKRLLNQYLDYGYVSLSY